MDKSILATKTIIDESVYNRHVLGMLNTDENRHEFLVGGRGCGKMARMCTDYSECEDLNVRFLYDSEKWDGRKISDLDNSHLINVCLMLQSRAEKYRMSLELFILDNMNDKLMKPIMDLNEIANMKAIDWVKTTPIYEAITKEIDNRGLTEYMNIVSKRREEELKWKKEQ